MATVSLKVSRKERRSVIRFLWVKKLSTNAIHSEMRPVYGDKSFTRPVTHFGVSSLLRVEKVLGLLRRNDLTWPLCCFDG